ncbi:Uncharacterized protein FWK35_00020337 [Aphis craccivora]|uniref:Uncharacterized protein n=1 Tax=Aphis craccivora TaxID=307492 RepID=A0A6G0ZEH6_APHCR|nr:Uncharacterized protein FWK35_00020337 [Aphis craccivora]
MLRFQTSGVASDGKVNILGAFGGQNLRVARLARGRCANIQIPVFTRKRSVGSNRLLLWRKTAVSRKNHLVTKVATSRAVQVIGQRLHCAATTVSFPFSAAPDTFFSPFFFRGFPPGSGQSYARAQSHRFPQPRNCHPERPDRGSPPSSVPDYDGNNDSKKRVCIFQQLSNNQTDIKSSRVSRAPQTATDSYYNSVVYLPTRTVTVAGPSTINVYSEPYTMAKNKVHRTRYSAGAVFVAYMYTHTHMVRLHSVCVHGVQQMQQRTGQDTLTIYTFFSSNARVKPTTRSLRVDLGRARKKKKSKIDRVNHLHDCETMAVRGDHADVSTNGVVRQTVLRDRGEKKNDYRTVVVRRRNPAGTVENQNVLIPDSFYRHGPVCRTCARISTSCNDNAREEIRCRVSAIVFYLFYSTFPFVPGVEIFFSDSSGSDVPAAVRLLLNSRTILLYTYPTTGSESEHGHNRIILKNERERVCKKPFGAAHRIFFLVRDDDRDEDCSARLYRKKFTESFP